MNPKHEKWQDEAKAHGWEWLRQIDAASSDYRHLVCGHTQQGRIPHMRIGNVKCEKCFHERLKTEAAERGWEWVKPAAPKCSLYRHVACGHTQQFAMGTMRNEPVRCMNCWIEKSKNEAIMQGWVWVEYKGSGKALYQHHCGNFQEHHMSNMRDGSPQCQHCWVEKTRNEAKVLGWEWVKQTGVHHSLYRHSCGNTQEMWMGNVRRGAGMCHACEESWATKPSNMYLLRITIQNGPVFLKLGIARNVSVRITNYGLPEGASVVILHTIAYAKGKDAVKHEKIIHRTVVHNTGAERFDASDYMDSGHTECYVDSPETERVLTQFMIAHSV